MRHFLHRFSGRLPGLTTLARSHMNNQNSSSCSPSLPVISLRHISASPTSGLSEASGTVLASSSEADHPVLQSNGASRDELGAEALTPSKVVEMLDRYIVGQTEAKRAVAVALRMLSPALLLPLV